MQAVKTIGLDIAKSVFQVRGVDADGQVVIRRKLKRCYMLAFFQKMPQCLIGMEACATSHHWSKELQTLGHRVRLMPPAYVRPYVERQKNDAADAEAICEATQRPTMRFVAVKTEEAQAAAILFRARDLLVRQRTQVINALRGHLAEFGMIVSQGPQHVPKLIAVVEDLTSELPGTARHILALLVGNLRELDSRVIELDREIAGGQRQTQLPID